MSRVKPSTSASAKPAPFVCVVCGEKKSPTLFPSLTATTCSECMSACTAPQAAKNPPGRPKKLGVEPTPHVAPQNDQEPASGFVHVDAEIDPTNPTMQELAARTLARRRLLPFIQRFRPKYMAGWVHEDICRRLERFLKQVEDGLEPRLMLNVPVRHGKQLADSTPMLTATGWKTHGTLALGDEVFTPSGTTTKVVAISEKTPSAVRVTMSDGASLLCHENHEWTVYQRSRQRWITVETNYWLEESRLGSRRTLKSGGRYLFQLPHVAPLEFPEAELSLHPYAFGVWLGDGSAGKTCITHHVDDTQCVEAIVSLGYEVSAVCQQVSPTTVATYFGSGVPNRRSKFSQGLKDTGALNDKHIPLAYAHSSVHQRLELLAGLIDTDGHVDLKTGRVRFVTVSDRLRDDVMWLVRSLGQQVGCHTQAPTVSTSGIEGRRPTHYVSFTPTLAIPTRIPRKKIVGNTHEAVAIISVERVEAAEYGHCIQVEAPDGLYLAGDKLTPTHNSEIGSRHFAPWVMGKHPDWEIIAASGSQSLALSFSRYVRDLVRDPSYQAVFPDMKLDTSSQSVENWNTMSGGGYLAAGVGTMITGRGCHILLLDDVVKDAEAADSQVIRDATWEWYMSTALTRLAPGGGVLGIMTTWNEDDWAGRVKQVMATGDGDKFEIISYPAINETGDEYILEDDAIVQIPPGAPVPKGARLTRPHNTALHPSRYTLESLRKRKANYYALGQQRWWEALYQQNPTPEGGVFFTKDMFVEYTHAPKRHGRVVLQAWDFAITEKQSSDWTVGITGLLDEYDTLYILDVWRFKTDDGIELGTAIVTYAQMHGADQIAVEDGQIWKAIKANFDKACETKKFYPSYEVIVPLTDKRVRAQPLRGRMQQGKVQFPCRAPWYTEFKGELLRFQGGGKHDDQVDAAAHLTRLATSVAAPKVKEQAHQKSWKDKLSTQLRQLGGSHLTA